ncbi:MAG TPA: hypothetical protein VFP22_11645, partial [Candidatus Limnocylindrales bacterium]|nr:hypothetical protein [Candidatus Limnocylindrales bacterium]
MPSGSTVALHYDGTDITQYVLPSSARFEAQLNAIPGIFEFTVKDLNHTMSFVTGRKVTLEVDGVLLYGGYVLQVNRAYPFEAMDTTTTPPSDTARYWKIRGVDFNRLFDTRVLRNPASYTTRLPTFSSSVMDGALVRAMWSDWIDTPSGFDTTTYVDDIAPPFDLTGPGLWKEQGTKARDQMKDFAQFNGALWYFDAAQNLHWHAIENTVQRWGFSDQPNKLGITASPLSFQGSTIGPRSIDGTESGDHMINDALAWGGSPFGSTGGVIFSRAQNSTSISAHERWQSGETHFGELGFGIQSGLDKLVDVIVNGSPATVIAGQERGLSLPQWSFKFTWFAHLVPKLSGVPDHIRPGYLATIELKTFGPSGSPLVQLLPLRQVVITFPGLDPDGNGYVQFEGE